MSIGDGCGHPTQNGWSWPVELVFIRNDFGSIATANYPMGGGNSSLCRALGVLDKYSGLFLMKVDLTHDLRSPKHSNVLFKGDAICKRVV